MIGEEDTSQLRQREFLRFLSGGVLTFARAPEPAPPDCAEAADEAASPMLLPPAYSETPESIAQAS